MVLHESVAHELSPSNSLDGDSSTGDHTPCMTRPDCILVFCVGVGRTSSRSSSLPKVRYSPQLSTIATRRLGEVYFPSQVHNRVSHCMRTQRPRLAVK